MLEKYLNRYLLFAALIAFVICHVTTYVASTTSNENSVIVSLPADGYPTTSGYKEGSDGSINLKVRVRCLLVYMLSLNNGI